MEGKKAFQWALWGFFVAYNWYAPEVHPLLKPLNALPELDLYVRLYSDFPFTWLISVPASASSHFWYCPPRKLFLYSLLPTTVAVPLPRWREERATPK